MRDPFPYPPEGTPEGLVRRHLDAASRAHDADPTIDRALARLDASQPQPRPARSWRPVFAAGLVAASLLIGLTFLAQPTAQASPLVVVQQALQASDPDIDRCYSLIVQRLDDRDQPFGRLLRESHLWTRGDRYRIDLPGLDAGSVGQDEKRRVWIAPTRQEGAIFEPDEIPEKLALLSDLRTLRLDLLLDELTRGFLLEWEDGRIVATPRPGKNVAGIQRVVLEVEPDSKVVRHLVVDRVRPFLGKVRITLDRIPGHPQPDEFYRLGSALKPDAQRLDRPQAARRGRVLLETLRRFGLPLGG